MEPIAQINEIMIEQRNEGCNSLDYNEWQANKNSDRNINQVIEENLGRVQIVYYISVSKNGYLVDR